MDVYSSIAAAAAAKARAKRSCELVVADCSREEAPDDLAAEAGESSSPLELDPESAGVEISTVTATVDRVIESEPVLIEAMFLISVPGIVYLQDGSRPRSRLAFTVRLSSPKFGILHKPKRLAQIRSFDRQVKEAFPLVHEDLPQLPSKVYFGLNRNKAVIEERRREIELYLQNVILQDDLHQVLASFLELSQDFVKDIASNLKPPSGTLTGSGRTKGLGFTMRKVLKRKSTPAVFSGESEMEYVIEAPYQLVNPVEESSTSYHSRRLSELFPSLSHRRGSV